MQLRPRIAIFFISIGCLFGLFNYKSFTLFEPSQRWMATRCEPTKTTKDKYPEFAPTPIVILTYPRSGSTFLGDALRQSNGVFYVFEPLHFLRKQWDNAREQIYSWNTEGKDDDTSEAQSEHVKAPLNNISFHFINGSVSYGIPYLVAAEYIVRNILTCRFVNLPLEYWTGAFKTLMSYHMQDFFGTYRLERLRRYYELDKFKDIVAMLDADCAKAKAVVIKTIRIPLFILNNLLAELKGLKILHLIRDPRPTMMSQNKAIHKIKSLSNYAGYFCTRMLYDITTSNIFNNSKQILRVRYENLADNPVNILRHTYKFLNLTYTSRVESAILTMTSTGVTDKGVLSTKKANSTILVYKWRTEASLDFVLTTDKQCLLVYEQAGYIPAYNSFILRNLSFPLFVNKNSGLAEF